MKKLAVLLAVLLVAGGQATAVVGADCPDGQPCIMDEGSSQSNDTAEQPDNTQPNTSAEGETFIGGAIAGLFAGIVGTLAALYFKQE